MKIRHTNKFSIVAQNNQTRKQKSSFKHRASSRFSQTRNLGIWMRLFQTAVLEKKIMNIKICKVFIILSLTPFTVFGGSGTDIENRSMAACVEAAKYHFEEFNFKENVLTIRCQCVRSRRNDLLPSSLSAWNETGESSAALTLVECTKSDIIKFYADTAFNNSHQRLRRRGVNIERINRFSACIGEGAYAEMRRVASSATYESSNLNTPLFRQMYSRCEAAIAD